ncbi:hypothetical protein [Dyella sedimenti]|uniref:hypothetical protein n=1 Tax=Dyella sedimenti TaxID=2919947 RepID=UPI001FA988EF|nr:hypothetical protein [Dyella sedimenti]
MTKTLYLISFYFAPLGRADGVNRSYLSRYLGDEGWNVRVICADRPRGLLRNYQTDPSLLDVLGPNVRRYGVPYTGGIATELAYLAGLQRDPFSQWIPPALEETRRVIDVPGIVYAVVPPVSNALIACQIAKERGLPLVLDFRDNEFGLPKDCVHQSALIATSTSRSLQDMQKHYDLDPASRKDLIYYNGYPDITQQKTTATATSVTRLIYAGLLNWEQDPALVARAAHRLAKREPELRGKLQIDYYGPSNYYTSLTKHALTNEVAAFKGYISFAQVQRELQKSSMGISTLVASSKSYCIPSKVFQYLAADLPIFAITPPGALSDLIAETGVGVCASPTDHDSVIKSLEMILREPGQIDRLRSNVIKQRNKFSLRGQVATLSSALSELL